MEARQTRMMLAAGGILVALGAVVWLVRESSTPMAKDVDASAGSSATAFASASASASASADAKADEDAATAAVADAGVVHAPVVDASGANVVASAASAGSASGASEGGAKPARITLDEGGEGKTIDLAVGQGLVLMLAANPTSGFDWTVTKAPAALGAPEMGFIAGGGDQLGTPGKRRIAWTVKSALPAGDQTVELGYRRSFEQGVAPLKTFHFKVRAAH